MTNAPAFVPPTWVTALLLRAPPPPPTHQPPRPPPPMRELVAQWLVSATSDPLGERPRQARPSSSPVLARFRGWLALVFRIPSLATAPENAATNSELFSQLPNAQSSFLKRSIYFASSMHSDRLAVPDQDIQLSPEHKVRSKKGGEKVEVKPRVENMFNLSPVYQSLYFSAGERDEKPVLQQCDSLSSTGSQDGRCVQPFFLTNGFEEGRGILENLKMIKERSRERERKRGWVPAVVSLILIGLNPLK